VFVLAIQPPLSIFSFNKVITNATFSCHQSTSYIEWNEQKGQITIYVIYREDLEGNNATVRLNLNPKFAVQSSLSIMFQMISSNMKLIVSNTGSKKDMLDSAIGILSLAALILFILSSIFHRMMGVELLHSFQLIYFVSELSPIQTEVYSSFTKLASVNLNLKYFINKQRNYYCENCFNSFSLDNLMISLDTLLGLAGIPVFILVLRWLVKAEFITFSKKGVNFIWTKMYNIILFPVIIGFIFEGAINISARSILNYYLTATSFSLVVITSLTYFWEWKFMFVEDSDTSLKKGEMRSYVPLYLTYSYLLFATLIVGIHNLYGGYLLVLLVIVVLFFIWFVIRRPYDAIIHNFG
jgi:hypothetical protein